MFKWNKEWSIRSICVQSFWKFKKMSLHYYLWNLQICAGKYYGQTFRVSSDSCFVDYFLASRSSYRFFYKLWTKLGTLPLMPAGSKLVFNSTPFLPPQKDEASHSIDVNNVHSSRRTVYTDSDFRGDLLPLTNRGDIKHAKISKLKLSARLNHPSFSIGAIDFI